MTIIIFFNGRRLGIFIDFLWSPRVVSAGTVLFTFLLFFWELKHFLFGVQQMSTNANRRLV